LVLIVNFGHDAGADGAATFADREAQAGFHCDWRDQLNVKFEVVAWHHHFCPRWQNNCAGHIGGPEVELWAVVGEEWRMTATFFFGQNIGFGFKLRVSFTEPGLHRI